MTRIVPNQESIQYDGTNGTYICSTWLDVTFVSDNGTTLVYDTPEYQVSIQNGWYVLRTGTGDQYGAVMDEATYLNNWHELIPDLTLAVGYALTPTILASGTANVAVDLDTTFDDTSYEAHAVLAGSSALLGSLAITNVVVTDTNTVTVTVQNNGLLSLAGATVIVSAGKMSI